MRIIVTGACGMIGSNLIRSLVADNHQVIGIDDLSRGKLEHIMDDGQCIIDHFITMDLSKPGSLDNWLNEADILIHLADVVGGVNYVFDNQLAVFNQNLLINTNVINAISMGNHRLKKIIYVGTACSFPKFLQNDVNPWPLVETDLYPAHPESGYGWSKLMGNIGFQMLAELTGIQTITLMLHNVYGRYCDYSKAPQVIPALISKAIQDPTKLDVWGNGNQVRDFVHVGDVVDAIEKAMDNNVLMVPDFTWSNYEEIMIGSETPITIRHVAEIIKEISESQTGVECQINYGNNDDPVGDVARYGDCKKAGDLLKWNAQMNLRDGIGDLYHWIKMNAAN
jgi:nucleoside-diphosphate-sugar epimerase